MNIETKLAILADAAKYDASCASSGSQRSNKGEGLGNTDNVGICHSYTPDGRCISLLKLLLTNWCVFDCRFCVNRVSNDVKRARFTVDEIVFLTVEFYKRNYIEGLFLSSGIIKSPDYTMEQLADVAQRLREREKFFGYIHLKAVPGASPELLDRAGRHADRLSVNMELPSDADLKRFAPEKSEKTTLLTMSVLRDRRGEAVAERKKSRAAPRFMPAGQSTQLIVGASPSTDRDVLSCAETLYKGQRLRRVYYSAYSPIVGADSDLPALTPPLIREHRLYQADWLIRFYGFRADELTGPDDRDLSLEHDPKVAWALRNPDRFPVDINTASRAELLRVPGLGVRSVNRVLRLRGRRQVRLIDLERMRVPLKRASHFIVCPGLSPKPGTRPEAISRTLRPTDDQLSLFQTRRDASGRAVGSS